MLFESEFSEKGEAYQFECDTKGNIIKEIGFDGFVPSAKITSEGNYSIISDHLGTPVEAYDEEGNGVWSA